MDGGKPGGGPYADCGADVDRGLLTGQLGGLLRERRQLRNLRQEDLAELTGVSQATVARIERGDRSALPTLERLFAALGLQLRVEVEPLDAHIDADLDRLADRPLADRIAELRLVELGHRLRGIPFVFDGPTAALVQGASLPGDIVHLAMAWSAADAFTDWLAHNYGRRWHERWEEYGFLHLDPRSPGAHRWSTIVGKLAVRMVDVLPPTIEICHGDDRFRAVPLTDVEIEDPRSAELLRRHRARRAGARTDDLIDHAVPDRAGT